MRWLSINDSVHSPLHIFPVIKDWRQVMQDGSLRGILDNLPRLQSSCRTDSPEILGGEIAIQDAIDHCMYETWNRNVLPVIREVISATIEMLLH